tara:strand:- start:740 stop:1498 length:759 start_codon:yes stop_codon:yes gene_type:complete
MNRLIKKNLNSLIKRVINESQLLNEWKTCGCGADGGSPQHSQCNSPGSPPAKCQCSGALIIGNCGYDSVSLGGNGEQEAFQGFDMLSTSGSGFETPQGGSDRLGKFMRRQGLKESSLLNEQLGTYWCQACGQTYAMNNPQANCYASSSKPCHADFDLNSVSCARCKLLMQHPQSPGNMVNNKIDQHCNQLGQPCYTRPPYKSPGKGAAEYNPGMEAKKGNPNTGGGKNEIREEIRQAKLLINYKVGQIKKNI